MTYTNYRILILAQTGLIHIANTCQKKKKTVKSQARTLSNERTISLVFVFQSFPRLAVKI